MLLKPLRILAGSLLVIGGIIVTPMPLPLGIIMIIFGTSILVTELPLVRLYVRQLRKRFTSLSARLNRLKPHLPSFARRLIEDTDPEQH
ncbi:PGPGW domain-containing protein [Thalassolituus marinus]|uniref:Tellurium resistance protein TerC n=1 Tax=Thalassolituus marinus TaxID=671053 RepID=A0ABS7ZR65_9GAMM|nr:PGPGW domain-containing protein [Thalassolituus marinus]MCA6062840.1 hypothetical protein [Thalassolituus marinus]